MTEMTFYLEKKERFKGDLEWAGFEIRRFTRYNLRLIAWMHTCYTILQIIMMSLVLLRGLSRKGHRISYMQNMHVQVMRWNRKDILANVDIKIMHQTASFFCSDVSAHSFSSCIRDLYKDGLQYRKRDILFCGGGGGRE